MWKKRKDIKGVGTGSIVELKAELYKTELDAKRRKATGEQLPKAVLSKKSQELYTGGSKNKGVEERNKRDEAQRAEEDTSWEHAQEKLRQKSELYDKMVRGEVLTFNNNNNNPDDDRSYLVDFEMKSWQQDTDSDRNRDKYTPTLLSEDMRVEQERRNWEDEQKREEEEEEQRQRRRRMADQLEEETNLGRKKNLQLKMKRKQEMEKRLNKIKQKQQQKLQGQQQQEEPEQQQTTDETQPHHYEEEEQKQQQQQQLPPQKPLSQMSYAELERLKQQQIERDIDALFQSVRQKTG